MNNNTNSQSNDTSSQLPFDEVIFIETLDDYREVLTGDKLTKFLVKEEENMHSLYERLKECIMIKMPNSDNFIQKDNILFLSSTSKTATRYSKILTAKMNIKFSAHEELNCTGKHTKEEWDKLKESAYGLVSYLAKMNSAKTVVLVVGNKFSDRLPRYCMEKLKLHFILHTRGNTTNDINWVKYAESVAKHIPATS